MINFNKENKADIEGLEILYRNVIKKESYASMGEIDGSGYSKDHYYRKIKTCKKRWGIDETLSAFHYYIITGEMETIKNLYLEKKETTESIGKKYAVTGNTISAWLKKAGIEVRQRGFESKIDQTIFDNITTEIQAYTLGLITADGNISDKGVTISITLTWSDKYILDQINEQLLSGLGNICESHKEDGNKKRAVLQFNGKKLKEALSCFGIVPNKSKQLTTLARNIPPELYHHYIRGLYDGDGVCSKQQNRVRIGFCGARKEFVQDYKDYMMNELKLNNNKLFNTGGCWQVSWSSLSNCTSFYKYIYKDATIFLGRKKIKLYNYVNTEVT